MKKLLIILSSHKMMNRNKENICILAKWAKICLHDYQVDYAGISSFDDFANYEDVITFKYKMTSERKQLGKICEFIANYKDTLDYDLFVKIRPEVKLLEQLDFTKLQPKAVNARARTYIGPKHTKHGMSVGGEGMFQKFKDDHYNPHELHLVLDDQFYVFDKDVVEMGGFLDTEKGLDMVENEIKHCQKWLSKGIKLNPIGIDMILNHEIGDIRSGHMNMNELMP